MGVIKIVYQQIPETVQGNVPVYYTSSLAVFKPHVTLDDECCFDCYHFAIPSSPWFPKLLVDNKAYEISENAVFPTNPGQTLACVDNRNVKDYIAFFLDKHFVENICSQIGNKSELTFANKSRILSSHGMSIIKRFTEEYQNKQLGYEFILENLAAQLVVTLMRELENNITNMPVSLCYTDKENIHRSILFLKECYNSNFTLQDIAKVANLSSFHFIKVFKAEVGKTPFEYLMDIKIEKSRELLKVKDYSITDISLLCGFTSASHFSTVFRRKVGVTPSKYRKMVL